MANSRRGRQKAGAPGPGRLRIVAGKWRSRVLPVAGIDGLRPTSGRVRETLFNWLAPHIEGARCIDLCAGTGALGFEALSRGARSVDLVENAPAAVRMLEHSRDALGAATARIHPADAVSWLASRAPWPADIVFLDPPYRDALLPEMCRLLQDRGWLAPGALVYLEQDRQLPLDYLPAAWRVARDKTAGNVRYLLLTPAGPAEA
ncbi:MAG: 16S rRNA (guanine(966)-N(2))-methyltransferase RsmD [Woeseiaceae bacterium]|nr:16S rRNA (guanine(966)-N(2))-methyltransferase RsmD [Woeseiaceae bacterium]